MVLHIGTYLDTDSLLSLYRTCQWIKNLLDETEMVRYIGDPNKVGGLEYPTCLVFKWLKVVWMLNGWVLEWHSNAEQPNHFGFRMVLD